MAAKERREMLDMPKNKKSPSDSPMHAFVSFTSEKVSIFWLVSKMARVLFLHTD